MALIDTIKKSCRIDGSALDDDISGFIQSGKEDLIRCGWDSTKVVDTDVRVIEAVKLYTKWRLDYQGKGDRYGDNYREYRDGTSLDSTYNGTIADTSDSSDDTEETEE